MARDDRGRRKRVPHVRSSRAATRSSGEFRKRKSRLDEKPVAGVRIQADPIRLSIDVQTNARVSSDDVCTCGDAHAVPDTGQEVFRGKSGRTRKKERRREKRRERSRERERESVDVLKIARRPIPSASRTRVAREWTARSRGLS